MVHKLTFGLIDFIAKINRSCLYKDLKSLSLTSNVKLARSGRHESKHTRVPCPILTGSTFLPKSFFSSLRKQCKSNNIVNLVYYSKTRLEKLHVAEILGIRRDLACASDLWGRAADCFSLLHYHSPVCCDMGQNDTIGKIELKPSIVLSSDNTNCKNDIQLFLQLFDELSVYRDYH